MEKGSRQGLAKTVSVDDRLGLVGFLQVAHLRRACVMFIEVIAGDQRRPSYSLSSSTVRSDTSPKLPLDYRLEVSYF
jgi:hypothetical protein